MSTESGSSLLRRAAVALRQHALEVPPGPWHVEYLGEFGYPQRVSNPGATLIAETFYGKGKPAPIADWIALFGPPVALALADLLSAMASFADVSRKPLPDGPGTLVAVARAILREEP